MTGTTNDEGRTSMTAARIHCLTCKHTLRRNDESGFYHHSGRGGVGCECACEGRLPEQIASYKEILSEGAALKPPSAQAPSLVQDAPEYGLEPGTFYICGGCSQPVAYAMGAEHNMTSHAPDAVGWQPHSHVLVEPASDSQQSLSAPSPAPALDSDNVTPVELAVESAYDGLRVSNSEIQTFKRCRRRWYISYVLSMLPEQETPYGPLALGTNVHAALAEYVVHQAHPARVVEQIYDETLMMLETEDLETRTKVLADRELAIIMLEGYVQWAEQEGMDVGLRLVAAEREMHVDNFAETGVRLMAKLDVEVEREIDGAHLFRDWKTAADFSASNLLPLDEQMLTYMLIRKLNAPMGVAVTSGLYTMLRKVKRTATAKPPFYLQVEAYHSDVELRNFYVRLTGTIREMQNVRARLADGQPHNYVVPPTVDRSCLWQCPWKQVCAMMDDGSDYQGVLQVIAKPGDPYERYTRQMTEDA